MRDDHTKDHSSFPSRPRPARGKPAPAATAAAAPQPGDSAPQRIAKVIARAGACSRRDAEGWIAEGRVALNGVVVLSPAVNVTEADEIAIDGAPLAARAKTRLFLFHKPRGLVATERDPEGRPTVFDYLREHWPEVPRLVSVGRLDINTEGLLLLTNDGGLARELELPATGWLRRYRVRAKGATDQGALDGLLQGVTVDGVAYAGIEAKLDRAQGANCWLTMGLREGRNREVKRVLEHLGLEVNRLIRLSFGPFQLGEIVEGGLEEVKTRVLRDQLGPALAAAAGVVFEEAVEAPAPRRAPERGSEGAARGERSRPDRERGAAHGQRDSAARSSSGQSPAGEFPRAAARKKPAPAPRKHVSALRADAGQDGARKRTLRSETADRSGRTVPVERLVAVAREGKEAKRDPARREKPASRNARRFEAERGAPKGAPERPMRGPGRGASRAAAPPPPRRREPKEEGFGQGSRGAAQERPRGGDGPGRAKDNARTPRPRAYDPAKDRSRPDARSPKPTGRPGAKAPARGETRSDAGEKRFGAGSEKRFGKPHGPKSAPRGLKAQGAGAASGVRGKDKKPGGEGARGSGGAPRGRPAGGRTDGPKSGPRRGPGAGGAPRGKR